jgi:hypothetical protein
MQVAGKKVSLMLLGKEDKNHLKLLEIPLKNLPSMTKKVDKNLINHTQNESREKACGEGEKEFLHFMYFIDFCYYPMFTV